MMYCANCGAEINEGSSFCKNCGTEVNNGHYSVTGNWQSNTFESVREQSMEELRDLYNYFSLKANVYDELDRLYRHAYTHNVQVSKAGLVWGIILICLGGLFFIISCAGESVWLMLLNLLIIGLGIFLIVKRSRKKKAAYQTIEDEKLQIDVLAQELAVHYDNYGGCPLGIEYSSPRSIEAIYEIIRQGRADTIKEAINLIKSDSHDAEMERLQRETAQAAWSTCAAARATAGFTAADYFYRTR